MSARAAFVAAGFAAVVLIPGAALAQEDQGMRAIPGYQPSQLELALDGLDARMAEYAARAEAIDDDASLGDAEREAQLIALWTEYQPDITAVALGASEFGLKMAGAALNTVDVGRLVESALASVDMEAVMAETAAALAEHRAHTAAEAETVID